MGATSQQRRAKLVGIPAPNHLNSWKEIAAYLGTSVRTVQRWEASEGLPVHRHEHAVLGTVYAYRSEIDTWLESRSRRMEQDAAITSPAQPVLKAAPIRRLVVLPFRLLGPDPEIEFLCLGLADAISASLLNIEALVVRSPLVAARYTGGTDLKRIAEAVGVRFVLAGTLVRSRDQIRVCTQLIDGVTGTVVCSQASDGSLENIFQLQDEIVGRVVDSVAHPLSPRERRLIRHDVPANAVAYECYLRANELAPNYYRISEARDLYARSIEEDPLYAPAWARLGRCCRVIGKFGSDAESLARAEAALRHALELNPDLAMALNQLAYLEADYGRAQDAMVRLLRRAEVVRNDPELFAGLVHVCRFCGLLDASVAAHERACLLDPSIRTSVCHTHFMRGHYDAALVTSHEIRDFVGPLALAAMGRKQEAIAVARERQVAYPLPLSECMISSVDLIVESRRAEALEMCERAIALITYGPEEFFYQARHLAYLSEVDRAVATLARAVDGGFFCYPALGCDPWLQPLRAVAEFNDILERAQERHAKAARVFAEAGGQRILGLTVAPSATNH